MLCVDTGRRRANSLLVAVCVLQVLAGTTNGAHGASVPPEWVREAGWRQDVRELLAQMPGLNDSQRRYVLVPCSAVLQLSMCLNTRTYQYIGHA